MVIVTMVVALCSTVYVVATSTSSLAETLYLIFPFVSLIIAFTMYVATLKGIHPKFGEAAENSHNYSPDRPKAYLFLVFLSLLPFCFYLLGRSFLSSLIFLIVAALLYLVYGNLQKFAEKN